MEMGMEKGKVVRRTERMKGELKIWKRD